jgi:predicted SAM-dependent methyltransferase
MTEPVAAYSPSPLPQAWPQPLRLHLGCGRARMEGWVNVDIQPLPGVDRVADVTQGLDFADAEAIFAEHFLEHLPVDRAIAFLQESHRVLASGGWIRLSTPNLDWVWATHYRLAGAPAEKRLAAIVLNRAFHGWRHQFLWNREMLDECLRACGFDEVKWCRYGESEHAFFQGIERHETYKDAEDLQHVLIVEARKGEPQPERFAALRTQIEQEFLIHLAD